MYCIIVYDYDYEGYGEEERYTRQVRDIIGPYADEAAAQKDAEDILYENYVCEMTAPE